MPTEYAQLGVTGIALILIIKELFSYLKVLTAGKKTDKNEILVETMSMLLAEVKLQNNNHLHHIEKDMRILADSSFKQVELLARIEGKLSR
jgi:hypothetical protein